MIRIKRIYEPPDAGDGTRFLVDRLWPRGISKERASLQAWLKDVSPSTEMRQKFGHEAENWPEFKKQYLHELEKHPEAWHALLQAAQKGDITLLYAAKNQEFNNAVVLKQYLNNKLRHRAPAGAGAQTEDR